MRRALVVEDSVENRQLVTWMLEDANYVVEEAETAEIGLELIKEHTFDVALMDITLPGISGDEAIYKIRTELGLTNLPIIALTGHTKAEDHAHYIERGANKVLTKPVEEDLLIETLDKLIEENS